jgi:hypothetical protein
MRTRLRLVGWLWLTTRALMNSLLGTIIATPSRETTLVARISISVTVPTMSPTTTKSPFCTGRSMSKMIPLMKLCVIVCKPKPIPTLTSAPRAASVPRFTPSVSRQTSAPAVDTTYWAMRPIA